MDILLDKGRELFDLLAILPARPLSEVCTVRLKRWIDDGWSGDLDYMRHYPNRTDLSIVFPDVKSVVVVGRFYSKEQSISGVARFANGEDYHKTIRRDLKILLRLLKENNPEIKGRAIVDTAPAFEKAWAVRAGFGWVGKNSLVINEQRGSFFNIGLLLLNTVLPEYHGHQVEERCGDCRLCIDSCPMNAIGEDRMINAGRCISCLTIERSRRGGIVSPIHGWTYGCDECQICCPFNR